jgi:hypothetical protein
MGLRFVVYAEARCRAEQAWRRYCAEDGSPEAAQALADALDAADVAGGALEREMRLGRGLLTDGEGADRSGRMAAGGRALRQAGP